LSIVIQRPHSSSIFQEKVRKKTQLVAESGAVTFRKNGLYVSLLDANACAWYHYHASSTTTDVGVVKK